MKACIIGMGGIGVGYDLHDQSLLETHFSALTANNNVSHLYCVDIKYSKDIVENSVYQSVRDVPKNLLYQTDLFVVSTPTSTHLSIILEIMSLSINQNAKFILEKPVGASLKEAKQIQRLLINHQVFVNYVRRSSKCFTSLRQLKVFEAMTSFNCIFEGGWANIGSHFIDFFIFANNSHEKLECYFENDVLEIRCNTIVGRFERLQFEKKSNCPYKFEIESKNQTWVGFDGGNTVKCIDHETGCKRTVIRKGLKHYQKLFYDQFFNLKDGHDLATIPDAIKVHAILEKINE